MKIQIRCSRYRIEIQSHENAKPILDIAKKGTPHVKNDGGEHFAIKLEAIFRVLAQGQKGSSKRVGGKRNLELRSSAKKIPQLWSQYLRKAMKACFDIL